MRPGHAIPYKGWHDLFVTIFLGGGGDAAQSEILDRYFAAALAPGPVVYVPTALAQSPHFEKAEAWFRATYAPFGITDVVVWESLDGKNLGDVSGVAAVYLGGGDTYYLLSELRRTGLLAQVTAAAASGLVVYGGSAGAIVLGADTTTGAVAGDPDLIGVTDHRGADAVHGWSVSCHYDQRHDESLLEWCATADAKVIALSEDSGAAASAGQLRSLGTSPVLLFSADGIARLEPGDDFSLE